MFETPILLIAFNDVATTQKVLAAIRVRRPRRLFFAVDAPRLENSIDENGCRAVKQLIEQIDWPCEIKTFFPETNLGPRLAVSGAISWFFSQVEAGIILEHDCLPADSFFDFCAELLDKYQDDARIMHISGNFFQRQPVGQSSYYFSHIPHIWGWATWRRAWQYYDLRLAGLLEFKQSGLIKKIFNKKIQQRCWLEIFDQYYNGAGDSWDWQWSFALMSRDGLAVNPNVNLVTNIGFNENAVHTKNKNSFLANLPLNRMAFPLVHPQSIVASQPADSYVSCKNLQMSVGYYYGKKILKSLKIFNLVKNLLNR